MLLELYSMCSKDCTFVSWMGNFSSLKSLAYISIFHLFICFKLY